MNSWTDFHEILHWGVSPCEFGLRSDKNNGHFTWSSACVSVYWSKWVENSKPDRCPHNNLGKSHDNVLTQPVRHACNHMGNPWLKPTVPFTSVKDQILASIPELLCHTYIHFLSCYIVFTLVCFMISFCIVISFI